MAVNRDAPRHASARVRLDEALGGGARVAFCWVAHPGEARAPEPGAVDALDLCVSPHPREQRVAEAIIESFQ